MKQQIVAFHQDEEGHWVAQLACSHTRHLRHEPPWQDRAWVLTDEGRRARLGALLDCPDCEPKP